MISLLKPLQLFKFGQRKNKKNGSAEQAKPNNLYDANKKDNYHVPKLDFYDINESVSLDGLPLLLQVREREANSLVVSSALNRLVTLIVGESGTMIKPTPLIEGNNVDSELAELLLLKWREFCVSPLVNNASLNFRSILALIVRGWMRDGDIFVQMITKPDDNKRNKFEFKLRVIGAEQLSYGVYNSLFFDVSNTPIEFDEYGRPIAYNFNLDAYDKGKLTRIDARDILQIANRREVNQIRGISKFAAALKSVSKIDIFMDTNLNGAQVRNLFIGDISSTDVATGAYSQFDDQNDLFEPTKVNDNLCILNIAPGKTLNMHSPSKTDINIPDYVEFYLRLIASSLGIDFEGLFLRYDGTYSSLKMSQINLQKQVKAYVDELDNCIVRPIYRRFVDFLLTNDPDFRNVDKEQYKSIYNAVYNHNEFTSIDPLKEANANLILLRSGLESVQSLASRTGRNAEEIAQQNSHMKKTYQDLGLENNWNYIFPTDQTSDKNIDPKVNDEKEDS